MPIEAYLLIGVAAVWLIAAKACKRWFSYDSKGRRIRPVKETDG